MRWHARLQELREAKSHKGADGELTKPTKPGSVSFVSDPSGRFEKIAAPALKQTRTRLERIARAAGLPVEVTRAIDDADVSACAEFSDAVLLDYLRARHERFGLSVLQWRALAALRDEPGAARAMVGDDTADGYRLAIALRKPDGQHVVGTLIFDKAPPLRALMEAIP